MKRAGLSQVVAVRGSFPAMVRGPSFRGKGGYATAGVRSYGKGKGAGRGRGRGPGVQKAIGGQKWSRVFFWRP